MSARTTTRHGPAPAIRPWRVNVLCRTTTRHGLPGDGAIGEKLYSGRGFESLCAHKIPARTAGWTERSDGYDVDETAESGKVVGITGVERQTVGVCGGGDEQVTDTASV